MASQKIDELSDATFEGAVLQSDKPMVVQFWAPWSATSRRSARALALLADEFADAVATARLNVDSHSQTASNYSVTNLPAFVLFDGGAVVARVSGSASRRRLRRLFEQASTDA